MTNRKQQKQTTKSERNRAFVNVVQNLPKGRAITWSDTPEGLMQVVDAKTGEVLSEAIEHPIHSREDIIAFRKLGDMLKSGEITVDDLRRAKAAREGTCQDKPGQ